LATPNNTAPRCNEVGSRQDTSTRVSVSNWVPAQGPFPAAMPLRVTLLGPSRLRPVGPVHPPGKVRVAVYRVSPGSVLHYEVALTNISSKQFTFTRCPFFTVSAGARSVAYVLNCRPAGLLEPGKRGVFAMQMRVDGPIGGFLWQLDAMNSPGADADVVVTG
jgi:hypothetical protein